MLTSSAQERYPPDRAVAMLTLAIDRTAADVSRAFDEAGIPHILLKGHSFSEWLYDPGEVRPYTDIDLLVLPALIADAGRVLTGLGFDLPSRALPADLPWHAQTWRRSDGMSVDLHRIILGTSLAPDEAWSVISGRTETIVVAGKEFAALNGSARLLQLALHAARPGKGVDRVLSDLDRALARTDLDAWEEARLLGEQLGATGMMAVGLRRSETGRRVADELGLTTNASAETILRSSGASSQAAVLAWLVATAGWGSRLRWLRHHVLPPAAIMRERTTVARRGPMGLILAYAGRLASLTLRMPKFFLEYRRARRSARAARR